MTTSPGRISFGDLDPELTEIAATDAKNTFGEVLVGVRRGVRYQVNRNGKALAVILGYEQFTQMVNATATPETPSQAILDALEEWPATEVKNKFGEILDGATAGHMYSVRRNSRVLAVVMDYQVYHGIWRRARQRGGEISQGGAAIPPSVLELLRQQDTSGNADEAGGAESGENRPVRK